jgi:hypothetical protein
MINVAGVLQRIENEGGTDVNPSGITALATSLTGLLPTLALSASAGKVDTLFAHYAFRFPEGYRARVVADGGTVSVTAQAGSVINRLRALGLLTEASLIVTCDAGKESVLYGIDNLGTQDSTLDEATAEAFDGVSDYSVTDIPDLIVSRVGNTVTINVGNLSNTRVNLYKASGVVGNFGSPAEDVPGDYPLTDGVTAGDFKYKASFVSVGTRNGSPHSVEGTRSFPRYAIDENSTLF